MMDTRLYPARLSRVIDGDTVELDFDLGFSVHAIHSVRLYGINCPELHGATKDAGLAAKAFTEAWFAKQDGGDVIVHTVKGRVEDKYGRYLARVYPVSGEDSKSLNLALFDSGNAVAYMELAERPA